MIVSGHNYLKVLCAESNNDSVKNPPAISPPITSFLDIPSLLSYSVYDEHAIIITRDGRGFVVGNGIKGRLRSKNKNSIFEHITQLSIQDSEGNECIFLSAVCGTWYSLFLLQSNPTDDTFKIAFTYYNASNDTPVFINTGERNPIALYGGHTTAAVICSDGSVIILTEGMLNTPYLTPPILILPRNEKAISVGCMEESFIVLSDAGRVYKYDIPLEIPSFPPVTEFEELKGIKIVQLSATAGHSLVVTDDGRVFGRGINESGRIGISEKNKVATFSEITELKEYKIRIALAGCYHSLFLTTKGRVLSTGVNYDGELLLSTGPSNEDVLTPEKSSIHHGATFGITGIFLSALFVDCKPPPNMPNYVCKGKPPQFADRECEVKLPNDVIYLDDMLSDPPENLALSRLRAHPVISNSQMDNSSSPNNTMNSNNNSKHNSSNGQKSTHSSRANSRNVSSEAPATPNESDAGKQQEEEEELNQDAAKVESSSGNSEALKKNFLSSSGPHVSEKQNENHTVLSKSSNDATKNTQKSGSSKKETSPRSKTAPATPKGSTKPTSSKSTKTPTKQQQQQQDSEEMKSLSSTSIPRNSPKKKALTPASKLSVSTKMTSESRLSMSTNYGEFSEVAGLRQQILEMKELLDSKDKEIRRLTLLNNALIDNDKDLQGNLEECWDNQQSKIDGIDMLLSKKRTDE